MVVVALQRLRHGSAAQRLEGLVMTVPVSSKALLDYVNATKCEPTMITKCLPALTMLGQHGISCVTILVQVQDGSCVNKWMPSQDFCDDLKAPRKHRKAIRAAFFDLLCVIEEALDAYMATDAEAGGDMPSSCYVDVSISSWDSAPDWEIHASVTSIVAEDNPDLPIRLS